MQMKIDEGIEQIKLAVEKNIEDVLYQKWLTDQQTHSILSAFTEMKSFPSFSEFLEQSKTPNTNKVLLNSAEKQKIKAQALYAQKKLRGENNGT